MMRACEKVLFEKDLLNPFEMEAPSSWQLTICELTIRNCRKRAAINNVWGSVNGSSNSSKQSVAFSHRLHHERHHPHTQPQPLPLLPLPSLVECLPVRHQVTTGPH